MAQSLNPLIIRLQHTNSRGTYSVHIKPYQTVAMAFLHYMDIFSDISHPGHIHFRYQEENIHA